LRLEVIEVNLGGVERVGLNAVAGGGQVLLAKLEERCFLVDGERRWHWRFAVMLDERNNAAPAGDM
jgi:hypothetical protein